MRQEVETVKGKPRSKIETCGGEKDIGPGIKIYAGEGGGK